MPSRPDVVERYLRRALPGGAASAPERRFAQAGELRTGVKSRKWLRFTARHAVRTNRPEFHWEARVRVAPLVAITVRDALEGGRGSGEVRLGPLRVASDAGTMPMHAGALHRYLAEAPWYPALLASERVRWSGIDERRALAELADGDVAVALEFRFSAEGDVVGMYTPARWGKFEDGYRQEAWEGHFFEPTLHAGERIPAAGDVGWYDGGAWQAVWRARVEPQR